MGGYGEALSLRMQRSSAGMAAKAVSFFIFFLLITAGHLQADGNKADTKVFRLSDRKVIPYGQMVDDLRNAAIVFVGENLIVIVLVVFHYLNSYHVYKLPDVI